MKKLIAFLLSVQLIILPCQRAYAVVPVVAGAAYAVDLVAPTVIRYLASDIVISSIIKAMDITDAYYSATSKISNSNFLKFFKSKLGLGIAAFTAIAGTLGYQLVDGELFSSSTLSEDQIPKAGIYWKLNSSISGPTPHSAALARCNEINTCVDIFLVNYSDQEATYRIVFDDGSMSASTLGILSFGCNSSTQNFETCIDGYTPPSNSENINDDLATTSIIEKIKELPITSQASLFSDAEGIFDQSFIDYLTADAAPVMPDNETTIPPIGSPYWNSANLIATGVAQVDDPSKANYIAPADWDTAYFLANTVAGGNSKVTSLNSSASSAETDTSTDSGAIAGATVNLTGIESRLDTANALSENAISEFKSINTTNIQTSITPDKSIAGSFWDIRYPDGIKGVFSAFKKNVLSTPIFEWLDSFSLDVGSASEPAFELCFGSIAQIDFGCYSLSADSYVWSAIKAMMIFCALIVSRRIVFGG